MAIQQITVEYGPNKDNIFGFLFDISDRGGNIIISEASNSEQANANLDLALNLSTSDSSYSAGCAWSELPKTFNPVAGTNTTITIYGKSVTNNWVRGTSIPAGLSAPITDITNVGDPLSRFRIVEVRTVASLSILEVVDVYDVSDHFHLSFIDNLTLSPYVDVADVAMWLEGTNTILSAVDIIREAKIASNKTIGFLGAKMDTSKWTDRTNTPELVRQCMAQLTAMYRYRIHYSESGTDENSFVRRIERDVWECLKDIRDGFIDIGEELDRFSYVKSDPVFTMGMEF